MEEALGNMLRSTIQMPFRRYLKWQGRLEADRPKRGSKNLKAQSQNVIYYE